jgi:transcriptional regulator with XRE-family HTH domain
MSSQYLREWMKYYKYTQQTFADHIGYTREQVNRWCNGDTVPPIVMLYMATHNELIDAKMRLGEIEVLGQ